MTDSFICGFGSKKLDLQELQKKFPDKKVQTLKQTHSNKVFWAPQPSDTEGDGLLSKYKEHVLVVKTADCVPILIYDDKSQSIAALHAGWRGIASQILVKGLEEIKKVSGNTEQTTVFIGPHILFESFECGLDVASQILNSIGLDLSNAESNIYRKISETKCLLNLQGILEKQAQIHFPEMHSFIPSGIDVYTDTGYHSFRRDKDNLRNLSYISLK